MSMFWCFIATSTTEIYTYLHALSLRSALPIFSAVVRMMQQCRGILASTLCVAIVAVLAVFAMLLAIPCFTVPSLLHTFASLPVDYYGSLTVSLLCWSELIQVHWPFI